MDPNQARDQGKIGRQSNIPKNSKMWDLCIQQAKAKFAKWPSPNASAWAKRRYVEMGGQFVSSTDEMSSEERKDHVEAEKQKQKDRGQNDTKAPSANSF